jgi:hypothetical protein
MVLILIFSVPATTSTITIMPIFPCVSQNRHPLPEHVYDGYIQYWKDVLLICVHRRQAFRVVCAHHLLQHVNNLAEWWLSALCRFQALTRLCT